MSDNLKTSVTLKCVEQMNFFFLLYFSLTLGGLMFSYGSFAASFVLHWSLYDVISAAFFHHTFGRSFIDSLNTFCLDVWVHRVFAWLKPGDALSADRTRDRTIFIVFRLDITYQSIPLYFLM